MLLNSTVLNSLDKSLVYFYIYMNLDIRFSFTHGATHNLYSSVLSTPQRVGLVFFLGSGLNGFTVDGGTVRGGHDGTSVMRDLSKASACT